MAFDGLRDFKRAVVDSSGLSVRLWSLFTDNEKEDEQKEPVLSYFFQPLASAADGFHRAVTIVTDPIVFLFDLLKNFLAGLYFLFKKAVELQTGVEDVQDPLPSFSEFTTYFVGTAIGIVASPFANLIDLIGVAVNAYKESRGEAAADVAEPAAAADPDADAPAVPANA